MTHARMWVGAGVGGSGRQACSTIWLCNGGSQHVEEQTHRASPHCTYALLNMQWRHVGRSAFL